MCMCVRACQIVRQARRPIAAGVTVLEEVADVSLQHLDNMTFVRACALCHRVIGTVAEQLTALLFGEHGREEEKLKVDALKRLPMVEIHWPAELRRPALSCDKFVLIFLPALLLLLLLLWLLLFACSLSLSLALSDFVSVSVFFL
jgi:hypothetical protein